MGETKMRRQFEKRETKNCGDITEDCEVMIFLKTKNGMLNVQFLPRDEEPNQDSPAVILAGYLNANIHQFICEAMDGYKAFKAKPTVIDEAPRRSILTADGNIARQTDDVAIVIEGQPRR